MWDIVNILESVWRGLARQAAEDDAAQEVYGIDALDELALHPLIQRCLKDAGYGVWPEQGYPSRRNVRRRKSEGQRCDVVLTPGHAPLVDPEAEQTLFSPPHALPLESAYWMEIKTVSQFTKEGPFPHYSKELLNPVSRDLRKLAGDPMIYHAGLLLVLFTADEQIAAHDLHAWEQRSLQKGFPVAPPIMRHQPITDRLGNAYMTVALIPVRRL